MEQYRITKYRESKSKSFYENKTKHQINQSHHLWLIDTCAHETKFLSFFNSSSYLSAILVFIQLRKGFLS